ncbi:TlpA family protein disulfide reductase [Belliella sp. DSM 111904]|uniref:TlpA family protein disulfide reductase n=1 Tax=Belliella filtrata TaxID=2923435 RepID=A0ABS9V2V9_9BACT|nr:TlpA disulfide reductase family protein [Belliella filtrata]MCH7410689.1 TlpA family protein disulfide reductase [Belliella filtrata]
MKILKIVYNIKIIGLCLLWLCSLTSRAQDSALTESVDSAPVVIYGEVKSKVPVDSLEITFWDHYIDKQNRMPKPWKEFVHTESGNLFNGGFGSKTFSFTSEPVNDVSYLSIGLGQYFFMDRFQVDPGDSVRILIDLHRGMMLFDGPSAEKFRCQYELELAKSNHTYKNPPLMNTGDREKFLNSKDYRERYKKAVSESSSIKKHLQFIDSSESALAYIVNVLDENDKCHAGWRVINSFRGILSDDFIARMVVELEGYLHLQKISAFKRYYNHTDKFDSIYHERLATLHRLEMEETVQLSSISYMDYLFEHSIMRSIVEETPITTIYEEFPQETKELLIGKYLSNYYRTFDNITEVFTKSLSEVKTPWVHEELQKLFNSQQEGKLFLDVSLSSLENNETRLSAYKDKVVMLDFWFTGCQACILFYQDHLSKVEEHFKDNDDVLIVSISADKSFEQWQKSVASGKYTSQDVINLNTGGFKHELLLYYNIHAYPTQMLLDRAGNVAKVGNFPSTAEGLIELIQEELQNDPKSKSR